MYRTLAILILATHLAFILWVIFGALLTRGRPWFAGLHIISLVYGIAVETGPWPCPLTRFEQWAQRQAGMIPYEGDFIIHYLSAVVYPDVPFTLLVPAAVAVCLFNLGIYLWRWKRPRPANSASC